MVIVQNLRTHNQSRLMRLILERGVMSRSEFASASGLSKVTSTAIVSELLEQGWLRELGTTEGLAGRPAALVELHPQAGTVLGLDLQPEGVALLDGNLAVGSEMVLAHHPLKDARTITEAVLDLLEEARLDALHGPLLHATLALPAPVGLGSRPPHRAAGAAHGSQHHHVALDLQPRVRCSQRLIDPDRLTRELQAVAGRRLERVECHSHSRRMEKLTPSWP